MYNEAYHFGEFRHLCVESLVDVSGLDGPNDLTSTKFGGRDVEDVRVAWNKKMVDVAKNF